MALANKYRPKSWQEVIGQPTIISILSRQVATKSWKNAYLFCGAHGAGKTTVARILANEVNGGEGSPIEIDGASNNGVDNIRSLSAEAQQMSIDCEYKVFIIDECVTGDTEILTSEGYKRIDSLTKKEKIAQYNNDGTIEFVTPIDYVEMDYTGDIYKWNPRCNHSVYMTPNHVQPLYLPQSDKIVESYIKDVKFSQKKSLIVSGKSIGTKTSLTPFDRIVIACQADGTVNSYRKKHNNWGVTLKKERKIERLKSLLREAGIGYSISDERDGKKRFLFPLPHCVTKNLNDYFDLDMSYECCNEFIDEVSKWDGSTYNNGGIYYSSKVKSNADFVSAVATLAGYSSNQLVQKDNRSEKFSDIHRVFMLPKTFKSCSTVQKTVTKVPFTGKVFCVKVPSQKIIIRAEGFTFVTGNCHQLTRTAWDAALKLIEEPPSNAIFIFCTTNPDKIPETILSRVQRFDFRRVSNKEIADRLAFILNEETHNDYERGALERIASLADGHVRDAIQYLDKCLDMSQSITMDVVETALGLVKYNSIQKFADNLFNLNLEGTLSELEHIKTFNTDLCRFYDSLVSYAIDMAIKSMTGKNEYTDVPSEFNGTVPNSALASFLVERLIDYRRFMNPSNVESLIKAIVIETCEAFKSGGSTK